MMDKATNAFIDRLSKNDSDTLYEMRRAVEDVVEHPGWVFLMDLVDARITDTQTLMEHGLHQHPEYTAFIGEIRGLRAARAAVAAVMAASDRRDAEDRLLAAQMAAGTGE